MWKQEEYITQNSIQKSSVKWSKVIVRKIWPIAWEMWQHQSQKEHKDNNEKEMIKLHQEVQNEIAKGRQNIKELENCSARGNWKRLMAIIRDIPLHGYEMSKQEENGH
jgi:hypothetical protein